MRYIGTMSRDFLEEIIEESSRKDRHFRRKVDTAYEQRVRARQLAERRVKLGMTQTAVARKMGSTQAEVSKIESGADVRISTFERYASVLGGSLALSVGAVDVRRKRSGTSSKPR